MRVRFPFALRQKPGVGNHVIIQTVERQHQNEKPAILNFLRFEERLRKSPFS